MAETGAVFGGEHSGHYYFRENYRADSGLIAGLIVLEVMSRAGDPLSELRRPLERYAATGEINSKVDDQEGVIEQVAAHFAQAGDEERLDGLSVDLGDWWFNLRPSNTEPLLRLNLEAVSEQRRDAGATEVLSLIRGPSS
jgi:phosphomannomutase